MEILILDTMIRRQLTSNSIYVKKKQQNGMRNYGLIKFPNWDKT